MNLTSQAAVIRTVAAEDLDEFGHVGFLTYQRWADEALLDIWRRLHSRANPQPRGGCEFVTVETHVRYLSELREGDQFSVDVRIPAFDQKRFVAAAVVSGRQNPVCIVETLGLSFDLDTRRVRPWNASVRDSLDATASRDSAHAAALLSGAIRLPPGRQS